MKEKIQKGQKGEGFHVICGLSPKNGFTGISGDELVGGDITKSEGKLDLTGLNSLLIADLDYFVEHHEKILEIVKEQIEKREYFREHPEEREKAMEEARKK